MVRLGYGLRSLGWSAMILMVAGCAADPYSLAHRQLAQAGEAAPRTIDMDPDWRFHKGEADDAQSPSFDDASWRALDVPHDWSIEGPFDRRNPSRANSGYLPAGVGWYRKHFPTPAMPEGGRAVILFDGVYMNATVWINGVELGQQPYGYTSFFFDLTPHLNAKGQSNVLAVRVNDEKPNARWYTGSGIYRHVRMIVTGPVHIPVWETFVTTPEVSADEATVRVQVKLKNTGDAAEAETALRIRRGEGLHSARVYSAQRLTLEAGGFNGLEWNIPLPSPDLWSLDEPNLYHLDLIVLADGVPQDRISIPFGIREFVFDPQRGFILNGEYVRLKGVNLHHDLGALGAAMNRRVLEWRLGLLKEMGCNAIRLAHNPHAPEMYELADRMGFALIDESFDEWTFPKTRNGYTRFFDEWAEHDTRSMVRRSRNHPSVVAWSMGNEIPETRRGDDALPLLEKLIRWTREEDPTRPVTMGIHATPHTNRTGLNEILDVVGYNYFGRGGVCTPETMDEDHRAYPQRAIYSSETACALRTRGVYYWPTDENFVETDEFQCSSFDNSIASWGSSAEFNLMAHRVRPWIAGEFVWAGFDYLGEPMPYEWPARSSYYSILDLCGFPKDIFYLYQSEWSDRTVLHLFPHWNWEDETRPIPVWVYSNLDEVELFLNGRSLGRQAFDRGEALHLEWTVSFEPGELRAVGYRDGSPVEEVVRRTAGEPAAIEMLPDRDAMSTDPGDAIMVEVNLRDAAGTLAPRAGNMLTFDVDGPARILGMDNGDPTCHEPFQGTQHSAFKGKAMVVLGPTGEPGTVTLRVSAQGLPASEVRLRVK